MTTDEHAQSLEELAEALGVTRSYYDGLGQRRRACDQAVLAVVRALGAPVERLEDAAEALRAMRAEAPRAPAVVTLEAGRGGSVVVPRASARLPHVHFCLESGQTGSATIDASAADSVRVRVARDTPVGYHRLEVADSGDPALVHVLVAPRRLPEAARGWGLFAPLYGIRAQRHGRRGFATYGDLAKLATWMVGVPHAGRYQRDTAFLGTLPLLACFFEEPFEPSPYSPISRAFWSELYVDPAAAPEFEHRGDPLAGDTTAGAAPEDGARRIDYRSAMRERRRAIEDLLRSLDAHGSTQRRDGFDSALEDDDELARYAAFRAAVERYGATWQKWPSRAREGLLRAGADYDGEAFRYHAYAQWLAREQLAAAAAASPAGLFLDLPLGCHAGGYDTWRYAGDFPAGMSAGAPADMVFEGGQDWGFPPLHPERARAGGYASVRAALRHHFEHAALLRVDHVMSLHRLFWIPTGFTPADGVYVRSHADELWSILAIEATRARGGAAAAVVGEDLGTVPDEVRSEMDSRGALRMYVVPFECRDRPAPPLAAPPRHALACLGTHDMETFVTWWDRASTRREDLAAFLGCDVDAHAVLAALLAWLSAGETDVVCANLEDLWLERDRQNLPGTAAADSNWKRPFARSFEEFTGDAGVRELLAVLRGITAPGSATLARSPQRSAPGEQPDPINAERPDSIEAERPDSIKAERPDPIDGSPR